MVDTLGESAHIQYCLARKECYVLDALPERMRPAVRSAINQTYARRAAKGARWLLENLARKLESAHPNAAASPREGLNETLTVMGLRLPQG